MAARNHPADTKLPEETYQAPGNCSRLDVRRVSSTRPYWKVFPSQRQTLESRTMAQAAKLVLALAGPLSPPRAAKMLAKALHLHMSEWLTGSLYTVESDSAGKGEAGQVSTCACPFDRS